MNLPTMYWGKGGNRINEEATFYNFIYTALSARLTRLVLNQKKNIEYIEVELFIHFRHGLNLIRLQG